MAKVNYCGWQTGDASEVRAVAGTWSVQTASKRTGDYALRVNPSGPGTGWHQLSSIQPTGSHWEAPFLGNTIYITVYFWYVTKPSLGDEPIMIVYGAPSKFQLRLDSQGHINAYDKNAALMASGTTVLSPTTDLANPIIYLLEVIVGTETIAGASDGIYELKINGVVEYSGTGLLTASGSTLAVIGKVVNYNSQSVDYYFADWCIDNSEYPGAGQVVRKDPSGAGNYTAWTGDYTAVDEVPHNSDTDYVSSSTSGDAETVALESGASAGLVGTPLSVKTVAIVRDEGGASAVQVRLRSGATDDDTTSNDPGATYIARCKIYNTDPATGAAWTVAGLDAAEVGVENNANVALRCTALYLMVWEDGVATSTPSPYHLGRGPFKMLKNEALT